VRLLDRNFLGSQANLQESTSKHEHNASFAPTTNLEVLELPDREHHNYQVQDDVDRSRCPADGIEAYAFALVFAVPLLPRNANWYALQRSYYDEDDDVHDAKRDCTPDKAPEPAIREDAEIEE
jgi:hypothetical protein